MSDIVATLREIDRESTAHGWRSLIGSISNQAAAEIEQLRAKLAAAEARAEKAEKREEIMCLALTRQIDFEWTDEDGADPGFGSLDVEYPYGAEVRTYVGSWGDCLDRAADPEDDGDARAEGGE